MLGRPIMVISMSDRTDAIRGALTDEWQSSAEIAKVAGFVSCSTIRAQDVWEVLITDVKYKLVEARRDGKKTYWRKRCGAAELEMDRRMEP